MGRFRKVLNAADMMTAAEARDAVRATLAIELKEARRMKGGQLGDALRAHLAKQDGEEHGENKPA